MQVLLKAYRFQFKTLVAPLKEIENKKISQLKVEAELQNCVLI